MEEIVLFALRMAIALALYAFLGLLLWLLLREPSAPHFVPALLQQLDVAGKPTNAHTIRMPFAWIGRDASCYVRLEDEFASSRHALLAWRADEQAWWIEDNLSQNGTRLNNVPVIRARLRPGDVITIGQTRLRFDLAP
ncbi:MAG: FHA domain-containing protein [Thermoflexales bacterium]|nr:FHA domain-containing protein [Thermoflexales bacterium]MCS7325033.1 FHA domain-containing protein [Thermoflexales bacterium]MCX7939606.1 FHA domain-containing protein [Thermoflexales bacterium]MDW8054182.1 FHA domain-containing protein [Anaerolineae bacterium]MDW8292298.1 FHA domain-containing protein [Anaerolineae bacterium]